MLKGIIKVIFVLLLVTMTTGIFVSSAFGASYQSCKSPDSSVSSPNQLHGLYVTNPPAQLNPFIDSLIYNTSEVCGQVIFVNWADVEPTNGTYNFNNITTQINNWAAGGKITNLVVLGIAQGAQVETPQWVLSQGNVITNPLCIPSGELPPQWQPSFYEPYDLFISNVINEYQNNPNVGYIRVGFGSGGENRPFLNFEPCAANAAINYSYSNATWNNYIESQIGYLASLKSPKQLEVSINQLIVNGNANQDSNYTLAMDTAKYAVADGIGIGSQSFGIEDMLNYPECPKSNDWCNIFAEYKGSPALFELQQGATLADQPVAENISSVIPFVISKGAQNLEIYYIDWEAAYNPSFANYSEYHVLLQNTFYNASETLGFSSTPPPSNSSTTVSTTATTSVSSTGITSSIPSSISSISTTIVPTSPPKTGIKEEAAAIIIIIIIIIIAVALLLTRKPKHKK